MIGIAIVAATLAADAQFAIILGCPRVSVPGSARGSGVVIGTKDGYAYVLTAAHVVGNYDQAEVAFTSRKRYPKVAWFGDSPQVIARWPDPDLALLRFRLGKQLVPVFTLAPPWQRPKRFPVDVYTAGVGDAEGLSATLQADLILAREYVRRDDKPGAFFWRTETPPEPGRSGGPLFDSHNRVIGITVAARGGKGYYSHHDEILAAIKTSGHGWLVPAP